MEVYKNYAIIDYNKIHIDACFLISYRSEFIRGDKDGKPFTHPRGVKVEAKKGADVDCFTFHPDGCSYSFSSLSNNEISFSKEKFDEMKIGRYEIYDKTPFLLFEVID